MAEVYSGYGMVTGPKIRKNKKIHFFGKFKKTYPRPEFTFIGQFRFGIYIYRLIPFRNLYLSVNSVSDFIFVG